MITTPNAVTEKVGNFMDSLCIVADLLHQTLQGSGYLDNWDEIVVEVANRDGAAALNFAMEVQTGVRFVNRFGSGTPIPDNLMQLATTIIEEFGDSNIN